VKNYFYINGVIAPEFEASISPADRGFLLGDGLFETILAIEGVPLFLEAHLTRLKKGLKALLFESSSMKGLFKDISEGIIPKLIEANMLSGQKARVRITISRGMGGGGLAPSKEARPTTVISADPVDINKIERKARQGICAITLIGIRPALPGVKSLNFMANILGASQAKKAGAKEGFFIAADNETVLEGTSSNVFIYTGDRLLTTPAATEPGGPGVLPGVIRQVVMEFAKEAKIPVEESWFAMEELKSADEVFITNSISGIVPVTAVDSASIGKGTIGPVTKKIQKDYRFLLEKRKPCEENQ